MLHLGCRTTNRVEGAHDVVKEYLSTSKGDLGTCWEKIDEMLAIQFGEIHSSFGRSVTVLEHRYKDVTLYSGLRGHMSRQAMNFIFLEEWNGIQERHQRISFQMKLEIKEGLRLLAFLETTMLSPPPRMA